MADSLLHGGTSPGMIRSVEKAAGVLSAFSQDQPTLTLAEIAERLSLPKATAHRYASSLVKAGLMSQLDGGRYTLGFRLIELGALARANFSLAAACAPAMEQLTRETGESVMLAVADWPAGEMVMVERLDSLHVLSVLSPVGRRSPIRSGALGKALLMGLSANDAEEVLKELDLVRLTQKTHIDSAALLAELDEYRELGYAIEQDEYLPDISGVAAPVVIEAGRPTGAVGIIGPTSRVSENLSDLGETLRDATAYLRPRSFPAADRVA